MARRRKGRSRGGRRNPFGIDSETTKLAGYAIAGGIVARSAPEMLLPSQNSGFMGYGLNLVTTIGAAMLAGKFFGPTAAKGVTIGGLVATGGRIVEEQFGKRLVEFAPLGLGNDPGYNLGEIGPASFPLPYSGRVPALPAAASRMGGGFGPNF